MSFDVRATSSREEFDDAWMAIAQYFGAQPLTDERFERFERLLPLERMHAAFEDGRVVGGAGAFPLELSVPGGTVPCGGVTVVGVYPTDRRRGVLRAMMRAQLDDIHERGEPIAALWASEETIYGRFGYGLASWAGEITLAREYGAFARPFERSGRVRLVEREEAAELFPPLWRAQRRVRPGMHERSEPWWRDRALADQEWGEPGGPKRFVVWELDGEPRGYAIYRHHPKFEAGVSAAQIGVVEAIAADPDAVRELWRFLLDIDWAATVRATLLPPDHPLFLLLAMPRRARYRMGDGLWVRVVDVGAALSARAYAVDEPLVLEVADAFCPWNEGRWRLAGGEAARTDEEPDLRLDADALGSVYLGAVGVRQLAAAGRIEELRPGALDRADAVFRWHVQAWSPEIF